MVCWIRRADQVDSRPSCRHSVTMRTVMIVRPLKVHDDGVDDSIGRCPNSSVCYYCCWVIDGGYFGCYFAIVYSHRRPIYCYSHSNRRLVFLFRERKQKQKKKKTTTNRLKSKFDTSDSSVLRKTRNERRHDLFHFQYVKKWKSTTTFFFRYCGRKTKSRKTINGPRHRANIQAGVRVKRTRIMKASGYELLAFFSVRPKAKDSDKSFS